MIKSLKEKNRKTKALTILLTPPFLLPAIQFLFNRKKYNKI